MCVFYSLPFDRCCERTRCQRTRYNTTNTVNSCSIHKHTYYHIQKCDSVDLSARRVSEYTEMRTAEDE